MTGDGRYDAEIDTLRRDFGSRVRDLRLERGLTQEGLAEATGLDRTFISNIEMGQRRPSLDVLLLLAMGLGLSLASLFDGLGPGLHEA